jgi:hypothetical protein
MSDIEQTGTNPDADLDARAAAALEAIRATETDTPEPSAPVASPEPAAVAPDASPDAPAEDAATVARRERMAARQAEIQRLAEDERARVAAAKARRAAKTPAAAPVAMPDIVDEASFFAAAEARGVTPQKLAEWISSASSPERVAMDAAKRQLTPVEERLREQAAKLEALERQIAEREQSAREQALIEQNTKILFNHLESVSEEAPLSARFKSKNPDKFLEAVDGICRQLPTGFTAQDVIDNLEELLTELQLSAAPLGSPRTTSTKNPKTSVAPANVGNRLAAERATTVEGDEDESLDLESRASRLKALLARG